MENFYIFTEIINCGKIGKIAIDSFHKHHNMKIHIYGRKEDIKWINPHPNNIFIEVDKDVLEGYKNGHIGTAILWEKVIRQCNKKFLLHFDSDTIFRGNIVDFMLKKTKEYDIIGPVRNYQHNPNNRKDVCYLTDVCQTNCSIFNLEKISKKYKGGLLKFLKECNLKDISLEFLIKIIKYIIKKILRKNKLNIFTQMIHGSFPLFKFKTIDFFDPIMFDMIENGAKTYYLDFNEVGGCDKYGKRDNEFKEINNFPTQYKIDFGSKLSHFSCVGSGMNFYENKNISKKIDENYRQCALDRYALFCKTFYNEEIGIDINKYEKIFNIKNWY